MIPPQTNPGKNYAEFMPLFLEVGTELEINTRAFFFSSSSSYDKQNFSFSGLRPEETANFPLLFIGRVAECEYAWPAAPWESV